jgi:hypothetical protein
MKTKKLNKKLTFSKNTIANLNFKELNEIQGGIIGTLKTNCTPCTKTCLITCMHAPGTACLGPGD